MTSGISHKWLTIVRQKLAAHSLATQTDTRQDFLPATIHQEILKATKSTSVDIRRQVVHRGEIHSIQISATSTNKSIPIRFIEISVDLLWLSFDKLLSYIKKLAMVTRDLKI